MTSLFDSPPQIPAAGAWGSLYAAQKPSKSRSVWALPPAAAKKPAYGVKRNLAMCTEALGCETGAVDTTADCFDDGAERKRRAREDESKVEAIEGRVRRALPPPLTTLAPGARRVRMVHERRDGRLEVFAVPTSGMETERGGGRLRLRLRFLRCGSCDAAETADECNQQEPQEAEEVDREEEGEYGFAKYVRGGRCMEAEVAAAAARRGKKWVPEQAAAFWVVST